MYLQNWIFSIFDNNILSGFRSQCTTSDSWQYMIAKASCMKKYFTVDSFSWALPNSLVCRLPPYNHKQPSRAFEKLHYWQNCSCSSVNMGKRMERDSQRQHDKTVLSNTKRRGDNTARQAAHSPNDLLQIHQYNDFIANT